jgi:hypothetical protein
MIKLNKNNQVEDSLQARRSKFIRGIDFDLNNDRGIIPSAKIKDASITNAKIGTAAIGDANIGTLTFGAIQGGTANFGGTANGDGVVHVNDSSGSTIVTLDNTGVLVNGGNIVVKNADNTTVIDTAGIVSSANFQTDISFDGSAGLSTSGTTLTDVTGSSLDPLITSRTVRVLFNFMGYGYNTELINSDADDLMELVIYDSALGTTVTNTVIPGVATTKVEVIGMSTFFTMTTQDLMVCRSTILDVSAGTHSYKLQYRAVNGGTAVLDAWELSYIVLGS